MNKIIYILGTVLSIILIVVGIYFFINIHWVVQMVNGVVCDGFGSPYNNGEPYSPYTIVYYISFLSGLVLFNYCKSKQRKINAVKSQKTNGENK